jgi:hypothetical protein
MPERTIRVLYYTALDGSTHNQGEVVDLDDKDVERGDKFQAFEESDPVEPPDAVQSFSKGVGVNTGDPGQPGFSAENGGVDEPNIPDEVQPTVASELTPEEIDQLSSAQLDDALEELGVDTSQGGSKASGGLTVDEKRAALKQRVG